MKHSKLLSLFALLFVIFQTAKAQDNSQVTYVIVHGAWGGGWAFKEVDALLTASGAVAYRPTLTGQGERVHLATKDTGLDTHIADIVNTILFEDLYDVILVGHSYGGMVVTGVADSIPERIKKLVYLDAMVPENGQSVVTIRGTASNRTPSAVDGFLIPAWVTAGQKPPVDVPHPYKTWTDFITLDNPKRLDIPTTYILTVEKGADANDDGFAFHAERARQKGWPVWQLEADHNAQWSAPVELSKMLESIANN